MIRAVEEPVNPIYYNNMSLGLLWINAAIKACCPDVDSRILDWNSLGSTAIRQRHNWIDNPDQVKRRLFAEYLAEYRPAITAISSYSCYMPLAIDIAELVRQYDATVPVVLGGFHATAYPEAIEQLEMFDFFVRGEGVRVAPQLIRALLDGDTPIEEIPALSFRANDDVTVMVPAVEPPLDLDANPPVDWTDIDLDNYRQHRVGQIVDDLFIRFPKGKLVLYEASQGCRYKCAFCEQRMQHGRGFRRFSPRRVLSDLEAIKAHFDPEGVFFTDEFIHYDRGWFERLLEVLRSRPDLSLKYTMGVKGDELDRELIDQIVEAGVVQLSSYLESGSERIRRAMRKPIKFEKHLENMRYASQAGLIVFCGFVVGWPTETREEVELSYAIAEEEFIDHVHMLPLSYLGRAEIGKHLKDVGIEPNSAEYFHMLNNPLDICLADYTPAEYEHYVVDRIKQLNRRKLLSSSTRRKLDRLGWEVVEIPEDDLGGDTAAVGQSAGREVVPESREGERALQQLDALVRAKLLPFLPVVGLRLVSHKVVATSEAGRLVPRVTVRFSVGAETLPIYLSAKGDEACFAQTAYFNIRHGAAEPLSRGVKQGLVRFMNRLAAWERKAVEVNLIRHFVRLFSPLPNTGSGA